MKFILPRNPSNRCQKLPYPAMQISNLAEAEELLLHVGEGHILLSREQLSAREAIQTIAHLDGVITCLMLQLTEQSNEIISQPKERDDPLDEFDADVIEHLVDCGADPDGLRMLLLLEESEDE